MCSPLHACMHAQHKDLQAADVAKAELKLECAGAKHTLAAQLLDSYCGWQALRFNIALPLGPEQQAVQYSVWGRPDEVFTFYLPGEWTGSQDLCAACVCVCDDGGCMRTPIYVRGIHKRV